MSGAASLEDDMSSRMIALLGLLAVAGYQNRERLGEMLGRIGGPNQDADRAGIAPGAAASKPSGLGGLLGGLFGGGSAGEGVRGGLSDLIDRVTGSGHGETARSWVETGPNRELSPNQLETALGPETMDELVRKTGLSRNELLSRLGTVLPTAVDKLTPQGRLPTAAEASQWANG